MFDRCRAHTRERCWRYDWVLDLDIQVFFDGRRRRADIPKASGGTRSVGIPTVASTRTPMATDPASLRSILDWELMLKAVRQHTHGRWVLLYKRWLKGHPRF